MLKNKETLAAFTTLAIVFVTVLIPLVLIGIQIFNEAQDLYRQLTNNGGGEIAIFKSIEDFINGTIRNVFPNIHPVDISLSLDFDTYVKEGLNWLFRNVGSLVSSAASIALNFLIFLLAFFYLLKDGKKFKKKLVMLSPLPDKYDEEISDKLEIAVNSIIRGSITVALIQGFLTSIGFNIFGIRQRAQ